MGRGDRKLADHVAVEAMRRAFDAIDIRGTVVIGEGERDEAPMLYIGETVGAGWRDGEGSPKVDIAVDPLEGTNLVALGQGRQEDDRQRRTLAPQAPARGQAILPGHHYVEDDQIDRLGVAGPLLILTLCILHSVVFYPAEIVDAAAGFA